MESKLNDMTKHHQDEMGARSERRGLVRLGLVVGMCGAVGAAYAWTASSSPSLRGKGGNSDLNVVSAAPKVAYSHRAALTRLTPPPAQVQSGTGLAEVLLEQSSGIQFLYRDGVRWTPHGVVQIAFVAPPVAQVGGKPFGPAYDHQRNSDYAIMKATYGMDSVRIQVSQPAWDPSNTAIYNAAGSASFRTRFLGAVQAARDAGLTVIISMQDESQSGETNEAPLPNGSTTRAWRQIAPSFKTDRGVMFELLNEPQPPATAANWIDWKNTHQALINVLRNEIGSKNVLIVDGLLYGERLTGAPDLADPLQATDNRHRIVYASHPYTHTNKDQPNAADSAQDIADKFGTFAKTHPVIVTEWTVSTNFTCLWGSEGADYTSRLLHALNSPASGAKVGLMAFAWDFKGDVFGSAFSGFTDDGTLKQSNWINKVCNPTQTTDPNAYQPDPGYGAGKAIIDWYLGISNP